MQFRLNLAFTCQHLFISLQNGTVLQSLFDFQDLSTFQYYIGQLFCRMSLPLELSAVSSWLYASYEYFSGRNITDVIVCLLSVSYQVAPSLLFDPLLGCPLGFLDYDGVLPRFSTVTLLISPLYLIIILCGGTLKLCRYPLPY